jgi:hypothetical protein
MTATTEQPRFAFVILEAQEIIELKQAIMDRDSHDAADFFWRVIVPRVKDAALKRGISMEEDEESDARLSG